MKIVLNTFLLLIIISIGQTTEVISDKAKKDAENDFCLRCHQMKTLAYHDTTTGGLVNLSVEKEAYNHSNHADLLCTECHKAGLETYPHPAEAREENLYCLDCHDNDPKFDDFHFKETEEQFNKSVHVDKLKGKFTCFSCHDPHIFKISREEEDIAKIIEEDNAICLSCHSSETKLSGLTDKLPKTMRTAHSWLPNTQLHWQASRCVECHTPDTEILSHEILPADKAVKKCEACHNNSNSLLFTKLYRFRTNESRDKFGFLHTVAYNSPYIIGSTRNPFFDRLSIILFGIMVLGLIIHGTGRWIGKRRQKNG